MPPPSAVPDAQRRKMFGYPALFVGGNLVTGLFADSLDDPPAPTTTWPSCWPCPAPSPFSPMPGRTMKGYGTLPPDVVADDAALDGWLERAIAFGKTLPAK